MNNKILEEIKERYTNPPVVEVIDGISYALIDLKNLEWLIEQAERVKELEYQNKRYKQVLEFYAKEYGAKRAILALEGEK